MHFITSGLRCVPLSRADLVGREPERAQDAVVERASGLGLADRADEREAQVRDGCAFPGRFASAPCKRRAARWA